METQERGGAHLARDEGRTIRAPGGPVTHKVASGKRSESGFTRLKEPGLPNGREWYAIYNPLDVTLGCERPDKERSENPQGAEPDSAP